MSTFSFIRTNAAWLGAGAVLTFLSSFGQTFFISLFSDQIRSEFALSHGEWGLIYSIGTMASAGVMIWAGGLTDRYMVKTLGSSILMLLAGACIAMAINSSSALLVFCIFLLRFAGQGMASHIAIVAMTRWFVATRGQALAICTLGFTAGEAFLPILVVLLMGVIDWRILWVGAAAVALAGLPILHRLLRQERTPQSMVEATTSVGMGTRQWTRWDVLRHPLFWFMIPALLGPSAFNTAFFFHQVHFASEKGLSHLALVSLFPIYTGFSLAAMLLSGWLLDRFGSARLISFYQLPMVAAFILFGFASSGLTILLGLLFLAITSGSNSTLPNAFWAEFYGTAHIGSIKALAAAIMVLGSAIGPAITGFGIDLGVPLDVQMYMIGVYFLLATICMTLGISRYRRHLTA